jgi:hypothetical protein
VPDRTGTHSTSAGPGQLTDTAHSRRLTKGDLICTTDGPQHLSNKTTIPGLEINSVCEWTDALPDDARGDADVILLGAVGGGADLNDLAALAEELRKRFARPDTDGDDGFADRSLRLDTTFKGAGKLDGDLTPQCAAATQAVLDALASAADQRICGPKASGCTTRWRMRVFDRSPR